MNRILLFNKEWGDKLREVYDIYTAIEYSTENFADTMRNIISQNPPSLTIITDYHPQILQLLTNLHLQEEQSFVKIEPEPFSHPFCHFSGLFLFSILWLLDNPMAVSTHSYLVSIPQSLIRSPEIIHILTEAHTPGAFSLGALALAIDKGVRIKIRRVQPQRSSKTFYEVLKNEFIHSTAALIKVLELKNSEFTNNKPDSNLALQRGITLQIPGHPFLVQEFISGFRKYAPFWKEYLFEDHFALLSAIYSGNENISIDDRTWIRIMLELIGASSRFKDKRKIARRIFPIYALYLKSIHETPVNDRVLNYIQILKEETKIMNN